MLVYRPEDRIRMQEVIDHRYTATSWCSDGATLPNVPKFVMSLMTNHGTIGGKPAMYELDRHAGCKPGGAFGQHPDENPP